jgi:hypothetical protein
MLLGQGLQGVWRTSQHAQVSSLTSFKITSEKDNYRNL